MDQKKMREVYAEELEKRGWDFAHEVRVGDLDSLDDAALASMQRAYSAGRDVAFTAWLGKLADHLMSAYGYTARQATEYVTDQPENWRDFFNDDYTPSDAAHEDALAGVQ